MSLHSSHIAIKEKQTQKQKTAHHTPEDAGEDLPIEATGGLPPCLDQNSKEWMGEMGWREGGKSTHFPSGNIFISFALRKLSRKWACISPTCFY